MATQQAELWDQPGTRLTTPTLTHTRIHTLVFPTAEWCDRGLPAVLTKLCGGNHMLPGGS